MEIIFIFLSILGVWYFSVFLLYRNAWKKIPNTIDKNNKDSVSVIVACRNEQNNISNLIQQIRMQNFDKNRFELIVVNDHSTDDTLSILEKKAAIWNKLKIICLGEGEKGKKTAIEKHIYLILEITTSINITIQGSTLIFRNLFFPTLMRYSWFHFYIMNI